MKTKIVLLSLLFLSSITAAALIVAKVNHGQNRQGFTLLITQTGYPADRPPVWIANTVRYQKADGSWKTEATYFNGRVDVGFGQPGRGVFSVDEKNQHLNYLSESSGAYAAYATNETRLRSDPNFVGEEMVLGFKTYHIHSDFPESGQYLDSYPCPALQGYPLRVVTGDSKGNKTVFEVSQVVLGEPSFTMANYPVDMKRYQQIQGTDGTNTGSAPK